MPKLPLAALLAATAVGAGPAAAAAQPREAVVSREGGVTVRAIHLPGGLRVDGRLDEEVYGNIEPISDFVQQEPDEGRAATERTEAWIFFDDKNVYVAARCWDSRPDRRGNTGGTALRSSPGGADRERRPSAGAPGFRRKRALLPMGRTWQEVPLHGWGRAKPHAGEARSHATRTGGARRRIPRVTGARTAR